MQRWWWRSVTACSAVLAVALVVAALSTAAEGDRRAATASAPAPAAAVAPPAPPVSAPPVSAGPPRATDAATGASVVVPEGWRTVPEQDLVPVPPDRFGVTLVLDDRAVVMIGALDPERVAEPTPEALGEEARRLVAAFADGTAPDADDLVELSEAEETLAGRAGWTALWRAEGGPPDTDGALVRVSTVAPAPGAEQGVVALAVVRPGPTQDPEARAADDVVRSLEPVSPPTTGP